MKLPESRRRAVSSLSPAKNRPPQQPKTRIRAAPQENAPSSRIHKRAPRGSVSVSQEESCLLSATGDVLVCRGREFAQLFGMEGKAVDNVALQWCEMECADLPKTLEQSALCNPWMPARRTGEQSLGTSGFGNAAGAAAGLSVSTRPGLKGGSTYEWGARGSHFDSNKRDGLGGGTALDVAPQSQSPFSGGSDLVELDDRVLSLPSFDYSHFTNGGNDMVSTSPTRPSHRLSPVFNEPGNETEPRTGIDSRTVMPPPQVERTTNPKSELDMKPLVKNRTPQSIKSHNAKRSSNKDGLSRPPFMHGVPTFLPSLSQIQIKQVSAHPLGSHVLLISAEALLFAYGLNDHGQLGIGMKSPVADFHRKFIWKPTIITPLLENGGKAITCAAGESHSLVVVMTEGRRVLKSQLRGQQSRPLHDTSSDTQVVAFDLNRVISSPSIMNTDKDDGENSSSSRSPCASESVLHHQLYGFGRNNFTKIGLVHPKRAEGDSEDEMDDVLLPRRVALHCTVWPEKEFEDTALPPRGIFAVAASSEHSAALVRRATGDIELYTWGNAAYGALGVPMPPPSSGTKTPQKYGGPSPPKVVPVPTLVRSLSYSTTPDSESPLLMNQKNEMPVGISLGPYCSFVVTSQGRCLSFGISVDGMLGHGSSVREAFQPSEVKFPSQSGNVAVTSVSAGTGHVVALTDSGDAYTWGSNSDARLGQKSVTSEDDGIQWLPKRVDMLAHCASQSDIGSPTNNSFGKADTHVVQVCAGCDCTFFVAKSGKVLSCGKMSGRLGLGELGGDVDSPRPLFGGLRLWNDNSQRATVKVPMAPLVKKKNPILTRGTTLG